MNQYQHFVDQILVSEIQSIAITTYPRMESTDTLRGDHLVQNLDKDENQKLAAHFDLGEDNRHSIRFNKVE